MGGCVERYGWVRGREGERVRDEEYEFVQVKKYNLLRNLLQRRKKKEENSVLRDCEAKKITRGYYTTGRTRSTRKASARERWEGVRAAEGASVSVRACRCLCREEGAHAQFSCKKAALNHAPSVAT